MEALGVSSNPRAFNDSRGQTESKRQDAEQKLKTKKADCDRLMHILQEQRNTWSEKSAETNLEKSNLSSQVQVFSKRVLDAELKVIKNAKNYALKTLLQAKTKCKKMISELEKLMHQYANNTLVNGEMMKGCLVWKNNIAKCI